MDRMVAFCGVVCSNCPAYIATRSDDSDALSEVLANWPGRATIEDVMCDGCLTSDGRLTAHCQNCTVRSCAIDRGVLNCAHCNEYICDRLEKVLQVCDRSEGLFGFASQARATLDGIHAELQE